jgi:hypothetical protein
LSSKKITFPEERLICTQKKIMSFIIFCSLKTVFIMNKLFQVATRIYLETCNGL